MRVQRLVKKTDARSVEGNENADDLVYVRSIV